MKIGNVDLKEFDVKINSNSEQLLTAKQELEHYLLCYYKNSLDKTRYSIFIGFNNELITNKLRNISDNEGFVIFSYNGNIYISGKSETGSLYGTYYFIENYLGVDWLTTDQEIFIEPKNVESIDIEYNFPTILRFCHSFNGLNPVFRTRQRCNFTVGDINDFPSYGGVRGLKFAFSWGLFGHTFELFIPYEKYYVNHPEYFSFHPSHPGENHRYQICLTNPEVLDIVTKEVLDYLDNNPGVKIISVSQNDSYFDYENNYCVCDNCKKIFEQEGAYSGVLLQFVNKVAEKVKERYPNVLVHTFAYHFTEEPPKHIKPNDNVIVQFCNHLPSGFYFQDENEISNIERRKLDKWFDISKNVFLWTYLCDHSNYFAPIGNFKTIYYNTKYFFSKGVKGIFQQENSDYNCCNFSEIRSYLVCKLFSYPNMTFDEFMEYIHKFNKGYYGDAGKYITEYQNLLDDKFRLVNLSKFNQNDFINFYADYELLTKSKALFEKAFNITNTKVYLDRLNKLYMTVRYIELCYLFVNATNNADISEYSKKREQFIKDILSYGVTKYKEGSSIPDINHIDFEKSPIDYSKKDKVINLLLNKESIWFNSDDNTIDDRDAGFEFKVKYDNKKLSLNINVKDKDIFVNDDNLADWEQDSVEIYISESLNRTNKYEDGDYFIRVNAHGLYFCNLMQKIVNVSSKVTDNGYNINLDIDMENMVGKKIGFEIINHDFDQKGKYKSTSYWNAFKFSPVYSSPSTFGIIEFKE